MVRVHRVDRANPTPAESLELDNAQLDLDAPQIRFAHDGKTPGLIRLSTADGRLLEQWLGYQNAATLGGALRARMGAPRFAAMDAPATREQR